MKIEAGLRLVAGSFVLVSVALGVWVSPWWFLLTVFVSLNLTQSALSGWCPMMTFLRRGGMRP